MSFTIETTFQLFSKKIDASLTYDKEKNLPDFKDHTFGNYQGNVDWAAKDPGSHKYMVDIQWLRTKVTKADPSEGQGDDPDKPTTYSSFTIKTNYELRLTTIPGLNIKLEKPVSIKFCRLSVAKKDGFYGLVDDDGNLTKIVKFPKFDFEAIISIPGEEDIILKRPSEQELHQTTVADDNNQTTISLDGTLWHKVDKKIAGIHFLAIGLRWDDGKLCGLINASVHLAAFRFEIMGLQAQAVPKTMFSKLPTFDFDGMELDFKTENITLGGSLLKMKIPDPGDPTKKITQFIGAALLEIKSAELTIYGMGAYAKVDGHTSLFAYFGLNMPLGGPAIFFVQGLAAGVGYNRRLQLSFDNIENFPLVKLAFGDKDKSLLELSLELAPYIPPALGNTIILAGIRFDSYKIIQSFALFVFKVTGKFHVDLYGISRLTLGVPGEKNYIFIEIKLKAGFDPEHGLAQIDGAITNHSFIFNEDVHLTGGFAFYVWWKTIADIKAGDFVLTVGGYHPHFKVPSHYPAVPRIHLDWKVSDNFEVSGQTFFALVPHAIMAGLDVKGLYHFDNFRASFDAGMHFLIEWAPFHYEVDFHAHLDLSYHINRHIKFIGTINKTLHLSAGVDLTITGPPFSAVGDAYLHIHIAKVITINPKIHISVGTPKQKPAPLSWEAFQQQLLQGGDQQSSQLTANQGTNENRIVCKFTDGLIDQKKKSDGSKIFILHQKHIAFTIETVVPLTKISFENSQIPDAAGQSNFHFHVGPVGTDVTDSTLTIKVLDKNQTEESGIFRFVTNPKYQRETNFAKKYQDNIKAMPAALWAQQSNDVNAPSLVSALGRVKLELVNKPVTTGETPIPITRLEYELGKTQPYAHPADCDLVYNNLKAFTDNPDDFPQNLNPSIYQNIIDAAHDLVNG